MVESVNGSEAQWFPLDALPINKMLPADKELVTFLKQYLEKQQSIT
ncbi:hypothetical protein HRU45_01380 [Candidatus Dependentiae bacterium]|nr:hypothetical protein [Candidatus Dependentiae bacterium]